MFESVLRGSKRGRWQGVERDQGKKDSGRRPRAGWAGNQVGRTYLFMAESTAPCPAFALSPLCTRCCGQGWGYKDD